MATPIGTGPNAIAVASIASSVQVSFVNWMSFALPLTVGMLFVGFAILWIRTRKFSSSWHEHRSTISEIIDKGESDISRGEKAFIAVLGLTALLWLTEPLHHIPSSVVAMGSAGFLFVSRMLKKDDLLRIDWSTLLLIAGGITLGRLFEQSDLIRSIASHVPFGEMNPFAILFVLCIASALLSALMSNTATAVMLIPLATALVPYPSTAILVAISASFGIPFVISTPQNAMAVGEGGVKFGDLFWPGLVLMLLGCLIVSLTGRAVLNFAGIP
jgi:sodium-dependent dicarboxylate transporter 2/3/5